MNNMNFDLIVSQSLNMILQFSIAFVPILIGVYAKESYDLYNKKKRKMKLGSMIPTALTLSCVLVAGVSYGIEKFGLTFSFTILFLIGAFSTKILEMIFNGQILKILFRFIGKSKGNLQESIDEILKDNTKDK